MNYLFFDSMRCPLKTKTAFIKLLESAKTTTKVLSVKPLENGNGVHEFRQDLNKMSDEGCLAFIWNGCEAGCGLVERYLKQYQIPYVFIEQGIYPQSENLRLMKTRISEEVDLGITTDNLEVGEVVRSRKNPHPVQLGKVCIVMQLIHDSSLYKLREPQNEFPNLIRNYFRENDRFNEDVYICAHPLKQHGWRDYNMNIIKPFSKTFNISNKKTIEECLDAELVIGFNSTFLNESALNGFKTIALDNKHILNCEREDLKCSFGVQRYINHAQFNPLKITITELHEKVNNL